MDYQRLRNLTTKKLHTDISHVYHDIEYLVGVGGIMTHQIPNALRSLDFYLMDQVPDRRFWDGVHDPLHAGEWDIPPMNHMQRADFFNTMRRLGGQV